MGSAAEKHPRSWSGPSSRLFTLGRGGELKTWSTWFTLNSRMANSGTLMVKVVFSFHVGWTPFSRGVLTAADCQVAESQGWPNNLGAMFFFLVSPYTNIGFNESLRLSNLYLNSWLPHWLFGNVLPRYKPDSYHKFLKYTGCLKKLFSDALRPQVKALEPHHCIECS